MIVIHWAGGRINETKPTTSTPSYLHSRQHHSRVSMSKPWRHSLANALCLALILGRVVGNGVEDEHLSPLGALIQGGEQLVDDLGVDVEDLAGRGGGLHDLGDGCHSISNNLEMAMIKVKLIWQYL
jgi:hypothetical protein